MNHPRPNILWYCTDQQRFDTIAALGNSHVQTPAIDRLVGAGTSFTHTYCQSPICTPSRSSVMTGLYPSRLGSTRNGNDTFPAMAPPLISKLIADSGYHCGMIGKFHLLSAGYRPEPRLDDGFSEWYHSHAPRDDWPAGSHDYADWVREGGGDLDAMRQSPDRVPSEFHQTRWASDRAIDFIARDHGKPWLLNINVYDPHPPFVPPRAYADRFDAEQMPGPYFKESDLAHQAKLASIDFQGEVGRPEDHDAKRVQAHYYAMIAQIDDQFSRIMDALEDSGQADNTVIIFTSDHGEMLGDHGLLQKGCRFYEGLVRVPLIVSWPGHFQQNRQSNGLVELLDLSATLLDIAAVEVPDYHQGRSLLPVLRGEADGNKLRSSVRCEYFDALDPQFTGGTGTFATMYHDGRYKLSLYHDHHLGELYDLQHDPWEFEDLFNSANHQAIKHRLIAESFDQHVILTTQVGAKRIAPM
ncbi:MAG: sulfatase-like hydrolase/transferase [Planctomycetes bacterium]|nr:sulfatase-like hydrolase/transferase [Planctomycetota bacterium]